MECCRKMLNWGKIASMIRFLVNARNVQFECTRVLHKALFVPVLMYRSEIMVCRKDRDL